MCLFSQGGFPLLPRPGSWLVLHHGCHILAALWSSLYSVWVSLLSSARELVACEAKHFCSNGICHFFYSADVLVVEGNRHHRWEPRTACAQAHSETVVWDGGLRWKRSWSSLIRIVSYPLGELSSQETSSICCAAARSVLFRSHSVHCASAVSL